MFYRALQIFFHFFTIFYCVTGETSTKKNEKRIGVRNSYQMCLDSFDIHRDKIIRTHESREMGAKYLNEGDVDSKEECLKFCCGTEGCDVFIFEEKKPGSCYLFQCGPLHDFKCKFTSHANYSSAVRTNYKTQNNAQLEEEIRISQQEHELKSLRKAADAAPVEYSFTEPSIKLIATLMPKLPLTTPPPLKQACSRNQYKCRSSGDCIAVYNVCDGIPQCADGSDEAADLVCPTEKPTMSPPLMQRPQPLQQPQPLSPVDIIKYQQMVDQHKSFAPLYAHVPEVNPKPWELPNLAHQMIPQQQPLLYSAQQMEVPQLHKGFGAPGYQWDYQPLYEQNKDMYSPINSLHGQNSLNPYEQDQPHIFNHKGSSVIGEKETDNGAYVDLRHPYTSHFISSNRSPWQNTQVFPSPSPLSNVQQKQMNEVERNTISTTTPPCDVSHEQTDAPMKSKEIKNIDQQVEKLVVHDKEVTQNSNKQSVLRIETPKHNHIKASEPKEHKSLIVIKDHNREHGRNAIMAEHLKQANENEVLRPRGAVISLALGLIITAIAATLIACRLRVVRRRGRRHGPYAHDADYLVNGMYL
ncbi:Low-density lipoprotein receptor-related protein 11 [Dufourea novaeangliae]|uniref:Low-density lipoprotein receptor-related protein 11 n=2 Tax=Dufourea novaeangliae TaxID=178035 RepID=A0A154PNR2_DUFNO|nr:Low-density lipoprotein receptor-related protein 11 [Dufourea novaeangliae]